jgi:pyridinium-3,5-bisthiocarboxylic acid mononucleotide nickel chelatase
MILASLISLGAPLPEIEKGLESLKLSGYSIGVRPEIRMGIQGLRLIVEQEKDQPARHFHHIASMIDASGLPEPVREKSLAVFSRLADAEAAVHGTTREKVHFHEVGAVDSIVDIVGSVLALHLLQVEQIRCSPLPMGGGTIKSAHGVLPLPAPATLELLKDAPVYGIPAKGETVTPTAAAVLTSVAAGFGPLPSIRVQKIGYGVGTREWEDRPNVLRAVLGLGETEDAGDVTVIETNMDDMNPELYGPLMDKLFELGALDVSFIPIYMKKNRPATQVQVLVRPGDLDRTAELLFRETTTIGLRFHSASRRTLPRESAVVETDLGPVPVKKVTRPDGRVEHYPEFEAVKRLSRESGRPLKDIYRMVEAALYRIEIP